MKFCFFSLLVFVSTLGASAQSRDTTLTKTLYYLTDDSLSVLDSSVVWSSQLNDYLLYSRLEMGNRMNQGIKYQQNAQKQFIAGTACLALSTSAFIFTAYQDPVIYVENHQTYDQAYFDQAIKKRDRMLIIGTALAGGAVYLYWRSFRNSKKSRWAVSPDGIKFNISSHKKK